MAKNIVVLVNEISTDYTFSVLDGIVDYFKDKDVNLILISTRMKDNDMSAQYWSGMKLAEASQIDGAIILSTIYLSSISVKELSGYISKLKTKNIVSISIQLPVKNSVSTYISCDKAYNEIVRHLKEVHGCKKIAFMSADETGSEEAKERFNAFQKAMTANNMKFDPSLKFQGYFVFDAAFYAIQSRYKNQEDVDFDALVAANDMMAFGAMNALETIGIKVPEDVKVVGYDDIIQAQTAEISLSTVNQQMEEQGKTAAELAWKMANGKKVAQQTPIQIQPVFRKSCGCCEPESQYLNRIKSGFINNTKNTSVNLYLEKHLIQQRIYFLLETLQNEVTIETLFETFEANLPVENIPGIAVCFYDKPVLLTEGKEIKLPHKATLSLFIDKQRGINLQNLNISFDPHKKILPEKYFAEGGGTYMTHPIFFGHKQYGYFISRIVTYDYLFNIIYLKTFSSIVSQAYIYTQQLKENAKLTSENLLLQIDNSELNEMSMIDSLTGVFNRRGVMEMGRESINLAIKMGSKGIVFFADMNDLKKINDNYGHEMGDQAIQAEAEIFKTIFRQNDIIGRIGGDEFIGIIPGLPLDHLEKTKLALKETSKLISEQKKFPFEISISFGAVEFGPDNSDLTKLITLADKQQYIEKQKYHASKK